MSDAHVGATHLAVVHGSSRDVHAQVDRRPVHADVARQVGVQLTLGVAQGQRLVGRRAAHRDADATDCQSGADSVGSERRVVLQPAGRPGDVRQAVPVATAVHVGEVREAQSGSLHPAARMIGTMNYGYAGTRELNEALVSRFLVIDMPPLTEETLFYLMQSKFPDLKPAARDALAGLYLDLQKKAKQAEITTRALDLRGLFGAIGTMRQGLSPYLAVQIGIVNKCFDLFEKEIVRDVVRTRIPEEWTPQDVF